jgi:ribonucleoside-diphosphate reductase beta chain
MYLKNNDKTKRWSIFPITHPDLWEYYKKAESQTWKAEEVDLSKDRFDNLSNNQKAYLKNILAFFTVSDGLVLENLAVNFLNEVDILEAQYYYTHQAFIEQVHANMYSLLIDTYIKDEKEKQEMFTAIESIETVRKKAEWAMKWLNHPSFPHRLVAFSLVEGLSFSSVFAGVFYFRSRNLMTGLGDANDLIFKEELHHYEFAVNLYHKYLIDEYKISPEEIREIVISCCEVEKTFVNESMPQGLEGLNKQDMLLYVENVADIILMDYGLPKYYNSPNNLEYMKKIGLSSKNNFFERRVGEYTKLEIPTDSSDMFDEDF